MATDHLAGAGDAPRPPQDPRLPTLIDIIEQHAATAGGRTALADGQGVLGYGALNEGANRVARALLATEAGRGAMVPICLPMSPDLVVALLGVMKAGMAFTHMDPRLSDEALRQRLAHTEARCVIGGAATLQRLDALFGATHGLLDAPAAAAAAAVPAGNPRIARGPRDLAFVRYTSGSTGSPKGVMCSHAHAVATARWWRETTGLAPTDRVAVFESFWSSVVLGTLAAGAGLHIVELAQGGFRALGPAIGRHGITVLTTFPSAFRQFAAGLDGEDAAALAGLRCVSLSAEPLTRADVALARRVLPASCRMVNSYGSSELVHIASHVVPDPLPAAPLLPGGVPVGKPVSDTGILLLDEHGAVVPDGQPGEVTVRTPFPCSGYWRRPELTQQVFGSTEPSSAAALYRTGDVGRFDAAGDLWLLGRVDNQVKLRGYRILPEEIEAVLVGHPAVAAAAVRAFGDEGGGLRLVAFVVWREGAPEMAALRAWAQDRLPDYMVPRRYVALPALPLTAGGKVDRRALVDTSSPIAAAPDAGAPGASEAALRLVAQAWRRVLGPGSLGEGLSFDEAGGDSLRLLHLVLLLERLAGRELPLERFHPAMRPGEMAAVLDEPVAAPPARTAESGTAVFLLPGIDGDGPGLAALRAACAPALPLWPVRWPESWQLRRQRGRGATMRDAVLAQIEAVAPEGPVGLVGYSYGGRVALAAARSLVAGGREVRFLCLLDAPAEEGPARWPRGTLRQAYWALRSVARIPNRLHRIDQVAEFLAPRLPPQSRLLHALVGARGLRAGVDFRARLRIHLGRMLLLRAVREWLSDEEARGSGGLGMPVTLLRAETRTIPGADDLGWRRHGARLVVREVPGDHHSMLDPANRQAIADAIREVAAATEAQAGAGRAPLAAAKPAPLPSTGGARTTPGAEDTSP
jgi:amino acid adenylation domain-containing protein